MIRGVRNEFYYLVVEGVEGVDLVVWYQRGGLGVRRMSSNKSRDGWIRHIGHCLRSMN